MLGILACSADRSEEEGSGGKERTGEEITQREPAEEPQAEEFRSVIRVLPSAQEEDTATETARAKPTEEQIIQARLAKKAIVTPRPPAPETPRTRPTEDEIARIKLARQAIVRNGPVRKGITVAKPVAPAAETATAEETPAGDMPGDQPVAEAGADGAPAAEIRPAEEATAGNTADDEPLAEAGADGAPAAEIRPAEEATAGNTADDEPVAEAGADGAPAAEIKPAEEATAGNTADDEPVAEAGADGSIPENAMEDKIALVETTALEDAGEATAATEPVAADSASAGLQALPEPPTVVEKSAPAGDAPAPISSGPASKTIYVIRAGDTLAGIAAGFGVRIQQLKSWNGLKTNMIHPGRKLVVYTRPDETTASPGSSDDPAATITYIVRPGSTLASIARYFKVKVEQLREWNGLTGNMIYPGQKLVIHTQAGDHDDSPAGPDNQITYVVRAGNTLAGIAGIFRVPVARIKEWNGLTGNILRRGQKLKINLPENIKPASYEVKPGDTLSTIARRLGVNQEELRYINGIRNAANLRIGQKLLYFQRAG